MNIKELIAQLNDLRERFIFQGSSPYAKQIANALLAQQVCIEQKTAALQRCTKFTQEDYDALALQPDLTALREHDADVCQEFANFLGIEKREDVVKWIVAVRKGE